MAGRNAWDIVSPISERDFGDLNQGNASGAGTSSPTRGVISGMKTPSVFNTIDYIQIATTGDAKDFGDVRNAKQWLAGCSSPTRGIIAGGEGPAYPPPIITLVALSHPAFNCLPVCTKSAHLVASPRVANVK